jgi:predicted dehydrogenase
MESVMRSGKRRIAIIGTGGISGAHLNAIRQHPDRCELAAIMDLDAARLKAFGDNHGIAVPTYTDAQAMLEREKPDLVSICTPPMTHTPLCMAAMRAGAWALSEKPVCASLAELDQLARTERETGCYTSSVFQWRFGSGAIHIKRLLDQQQLGRPLVGICNTVWFRGHGYYDVPWRGKWHTELGGPTMGHGIHAMDLFLHLLGPFAEVSAVTATLDRRIEVEDVSAAVVRFESGAIGTVVNSILSPREESYLRLDTQQATVELTHLYCHENQHWKITGLPEHKDQPLPEAWTAMPPNQPSNHAAQMGAMLDAMDAGVRPPVSGEEARTTIEFITCLYKSASLGRAVARGSIAPGDPFYEHVAGKPILAEAVT